jgi:hypothetical protein
MAEDLSAAIGELLGESVGAAAARRTGSDNASAADTHAPAWRARALELIREADERLRAGDFAGFGAAWSRLRALLETQAPR